MIVFADSSALVTRYAPHEDDVLPLDIGIAVSALARVEVVSALWRQSSGGEIGVVEAGALVREFGSDWDGTRTESRRFQPVAATRSLLERAAALTGTHGLRSLDAIQLASALAARDAEPECRTMVVLDELLRRAAAAERFDLLPLGCRHEACRIIHCPRHRPRDDVLEHRSGVHAHRPVVA